MRQTLNEWFKCAELDAGSPEGVITVQTQWVKELQREVKELGRAKEKRKLASAFSAQSEFDRRRNS